MKRIYKISVVVTLVLLALVSVERASAQGGVHSYDLSDYNVVSERGIIHTEWGVGVGGVFTLARPITEGVDIAPRIGLQGHLDMAVCFGQNFAIETKIIYGGGSMDVRAQYVDSGGVMRSFDKRVKTRTMDIPVLLSARALNSRLRFNAGVMFTVLSRGEYNEGNDVMMYGAVAPTFNLTAGMGVCITRNFMLEARYIFALQTTANQINGSQQSPGLEFDSRYDRIVAGVTVLF